MACSSFCEAEGGVVVCPSFEPHTATSVPGSGQAARQWSVARNLQNRSFCKIPVIRGSQNYPQKQIRG